MEWLSKIVDIIKIPTKYFWIILLISLILLFIPDSWLNNFKLLELRNAYHLYISLAFIITFSIVTVESTIFVYKKIKLNFSLKNYKKNLLYNISRLDPKEQSVLREFFLQNQNTLRLPYDEPIVAGLIKKDILKIVGQLGEQSLAGVLLPIEINPVIKDDILPEQIHFPKSNPLTKDEEEFLLNNRPDFMQEIHHHIKLFHRGWWR